MKADVAWAGVKDAGAMSLPNHLDPALPSLEPRTLLSTSTSQRLARELEILVLDIKFKKNNVPMPIPFSKDAEVRLRICV